MPKNNNICVFAGTSIGQSDIFTDKARELGNLIANQGSTLIYGGSKLGCMGAIAEGVLEKGGKAIGIITQDLLDVNIQHTRLTELIVVDTLAERKKMMVEKADAFIALPGGYGTVDELMEVLTLQQLAVHSKPIGLLNVNGFYSRFLEFIDNMVNNDFLRDDHKNMIVDREDSTVLLHALENYNPPNIAAWIESFKKDQKTGLTYHPYSKSKED